MKNRTQIRSTALAAALMLAAAAPAFAEDSAATKDGVYTKAISSERQMTRQEVVDELIAARNARTLTPAGEAGAFENESRLTSVASREDVRGDFIHARNAGMLSPSGEGTDGSTVLAARDAYNVAQAQQILTAQAEAADRERLLALLNTPSSTIVASSESSEPTTVAAASQPTMITETADGQVIDVQPATTETMPAETPAAPQDEPTAQQDPLAVKSEDTPATLGESTQPIEGGTNDDTPTAPTTSDAAAGTVEGMTNEVATEPSQQ